eukprot:922767-Rhodomonas_salina.1
MRRDVCVCCGEEAAPVGELDSLVEGMVLAELAEGHEGPGWVLAHPPVARRRMRQIESRRMRSIERRRVLWI